MNALKIITLLGLSAIFLYSFRSVPQTDPLKESMKRGKNVYATYCQACHQSQGEGIEGIYPPVAKSDYLMADKNRAIKQILNGINDPIKVNGKSYSMPMPAQALSDQEAADVLNYIRHNWNNPSLVKKVGMIKASEVKALR